MTIKGIVLDNAGTLGGLVLRGPASGVATIQFPDTSSAVDGQNFAFDVASGALKLVTPVVVTVPTAVSAFSNDAGYQNAAAVTATVNTAIAAVVGAAPTALDTLAKIDAALAADESAAGALTTLVSGKADSASLAPVAFSGVYSDLTGKPASVTVPTLVSAFTNDAGYALSSSLATVAHTGSYTDLLNQPSIPTVPTLVSAFTNDAGYQTSAQVVTALGSYATTASLGSYATTASLAPYALTSALSAYATTASLAPYATTASLATVATTGNYADLIGVPAAVVVPTVVSAFTNDSGYQTAAQVSTAIAGKTDTSSLAPVATSGSYNDLTSKPTIPTVPTVVSAFSNDAGYQTAASVASALAPYALTSSLAPYALTSALSSYATTASLAPYALSSSLATVATTGAYGDLTGTPAAVVVPTLVSAFTNDAGYLTTVPVATTSVVGGVKVGSGLEVAGDGTLTATGSVLLSNGNGTKTAVATVATTDASVVTVVAQAVDVAQVVQFTADVVGKTSGSAVVAAFTLEGAIKNVGGTIVVVGGAVLKDIIALEDTSWDANATTDGSGLVITVQGSAGSSVTWVVSIKTTSIA